MNKYIKHNLKHYEDKSFIRNTYEGKCGYRCVKCGEEISPATVNFYQDKYSNWQSELLCYDCQGKG